MQLFVLTTHCTSKAHCLTCRNLEGGRNWRESLSRNFELPDGKVDFECPYSIPWNKVEPPAAKTVPETAKMATPPSSSTKESRLADRRANLAKRSSGTRGTGDCGCSRNK